MPPPPVLTSVIICLDKVRPDGPTESLNLISACQEIVIFGPNPDAHWKGIIYFAFEGGAGTYRWQAIWRMPTGNEAVATGVFKSDSARPMQSGFVDPATFPCPVDGAYRLLFSIGASRQVSQTILVRRNVPPPK